MIEPGFCNRVAARHATTPIAFVKPCKRNLDPLLFGIAAPLGRLSHCLLLHRVHPGQTANRILLEPHW